MQTGEYFAKSANTSAAKMEEWTVKMHAIAARTEQETVAMGIITFFTLVLLPSTFVAVRYGPSPSSLASAAALASVSLTRGWQTFFSSGILRFDDDKSGSSKMGDWGLHRPALNLFLAMSLPLMGITLATWALYRSAAFRRARTRSVMEELPLSEKSGENIDDDDDGFPVR